MRNHREETTWNVISGVSGALRCGGATGVVIGDSPCRDPGRVWEVGAKQLGDSMMFLMWVGAFENKSLPFRRLKSLCWNP